MKLHELMVLVGLCLAIRSNAQLTLEADLTPGWEGSNVEGLTVFNNELVFAGGFGPLGVELWKYDGVQASLIANLFPENHQSSYPQYFTEYNGKLYFGAQGTGQAAGLYSYDGSVVSVIATNGAGFGYTPQYLCVYNGYLFYGAGGRLYRYDGTNTPVIMTVPGGILNLDPKHLTVYDGKLYFAGEHTTAGRELWSYDGTTFTLVADLWASYGWSQPNSLKAFNGKLYFSANNGTTGSELWSYDGTTLSPLMDINPGGNGVYDPVPWTELGSWLYFVANDGTEGWELWRTDGTTTEMALTKPGTAAVNPFCMSAFNGALYMRGDLYGTLVTDYIRFDGIVASAVGVDITNDFSNGNPAQAGVVFQGKLFMPAYSYTHGRELYSYSGTCGFFSISPIAQGACETGSVYDQTLSIVAYEPPNSGSLVVNGQVFPIAPGPQTIVLQNLPADGQPVDVMAHFDATPSCQVTRTALFMAPPPCTPPCTTDLNLIFNGDGVTAVSWELRQQGSNILVQSGAPFVYPDHVFTPEYSVSTCMPDGDFYLVVSSNGNGITANGRTGGYRLQTSAGVRLIDNTNNFLSGATSQVANGQGFTLPAGTDRVIYTSCDKMDWRSNEYIVANNNPAVAAYHGGAFAAQTGYEMWFYNPNGGYSFRRFHSHAVSDGFAPNNPQRACHIRVNGWGGVNTIPAQSDLLNVKVRGRIMNNLQTATVNLPWGPACRFKMDANRAECPLTHLMDVPGNQYLSCGGTRAIGTGGANLVHARLVRRYLGGVSTAANRYQFRFMAEDTTYKTSAIGQYWVNTAGLDPCTPYQVEVRASFNSGSTWCDTYAASNPYAPGWGRICYLNTACAAGGGNQNMTASGSAGSQGQLSLYPNPNNGEQLFLSIDMVKEGVETLSVDIYDTFGKCVSASTIAVNTGSGPGQALGFVNTALDLNGSLAAGIYIVNITAGDDTYTERLVIQP